MTIFARRDLFNLCILRNLRNVRGLARFGADRSGNVAVIFAMMSVVLLLSIGAAVDIGRWLHARDQTVAAVDAAVLAGGRALQTNSDEDAAVAAAQKFYAQNITSRLPVTGDTISFAVGDNGTSMTASGTAYIKTPFLQFANIDKLPLVSTSETQFSKAQLATGGNGGENLEIAMMLDVTGSMAGQKLSDLKDSAKDLINIVIWDDQSKFTSKVAVVPFSEDIRFPNSGAMNKARGTSLPASKTVGSGRNQKTYYLSDCVVERTGSQKYTDAAPASGQYVMGHYTANSTGTGSSRKGVCTIPAGAELMPLTSKKDDLIAKVDGLSAAGGTAGQLGTAWAWYMLSPNWSTLWPAINRPEAYGTENLQKIAILMTDGEYNRQYDSNGISASASAAANGSSTTQARALCTAMKATGITVYTVGFQLGGNKTAIETLNRCATEPGKFYNADDGDQLKQAFRDIALKLTSLYLSK